MPRSPFNVLVYPYHRSASGELRYALLKRREGWWQAIAGGGEGSETPQQAARRETREEVGVLEDSSLLELSTVIPVPVTAFEGTNWGSDLYVIPEYCFGSPVGRTNLMISAEHTEYRWLSYEEAQALIRYDGDKTALWELHSRLLECGPRGLGSQGL